MKNYFTSYKIIYMPINRFKHVHIFLFAFNTEIKFKMFMQIYRKISPLDLTINKYDLRFLIIILILMVYIMI